MELSKNVDKSSFGDLAREVRLINTINLKSGLFCIPLLLNEVLTYDYENIKLLAKTKRIINKSFINGTDFLRFDDIVIKEKNVLIDKETELKNNIILTSQITNIKDENIKKIIDKLSEIPCIKEILNDSVAGYIKRTFLLSFLYNKGYTKDEAELILKTFISVDKWNNSHCVRTHTQKIYEKYHYNIISCYKIKELGLCPYSDKQNECKKYNNIL